MGVSRAAARLGGTALGVSRFGGLFIYFIFRNIFLKFEKRFEF